MEQVSENIQEELSNEKELSIEEVLTKQLEETNDKYLRILAEFDNFRKRTIKEKSELIKNASENIIVNILPVLDDLERAMNNDNNDGLKLIYNNFINILKQNNVEKIKTLNQFFDIELHEAIATADGEINKIIECIQNGYTLNGKVIRHAKVIVGK